MFNFILSIIFIFFLGGMLGYVLELLYSRFVHNRWINPGFFVGPYVPIYGVGIAIATVICIIFDNYNINELITIITIGLLLTIVELIAGLIFKKNGIKLWDYSNYAFNYKGIICFHYSFLWIMLAVIYYFFIYKYIIIIMDFCKNNPLIYVIVGIFLGIFILDFIYSFKILFELRKQALKNNVEIKYDEFKKCIKEVQEKRKNKYSFLFAFKQDKPLSSYIKNYKKKK